MDMDIDVRNGLVGNKSGMLLFVDMREDVRVFDQAGKILRFGL
jgi:hypothetical protein